VYVPDTGPQIQSRESPIVLCRRGDGSAPAVGKPQKATVTAAAGYRRYQWYVNNEQKGNTMTLELDAADYSPGVHSLEVLFSRDGKETSGVRRLTFRVVGEGTPRSRVE
jgi:hypothetical protein